MKKKSSYIYYIKTRKTICYKLILSYYSLNYLIILMCDDLINQLVYFLQEFRITCCIWRIRLNMTNQPVILVWTRSGMMYLLCISIWDTSYVPETNNLNESHCFVQCKFNSKSTQQWHVHWLHLLLFFAHSFQHLVRRLFIYDNYKTIIQVVNSD